MKESIKKAFTENLILKILSVFLAILIWIVVLNINDPATTRVVSGIKVEVANDSVITDNDMVYRITGGQEISVKVTGPRTLVDSLTASDFVAQADFMDISQANSVPISVELKEYAYQQKVTISWQSYNTLRLKVEDVTEESYEVKVRYIGTLPEGYLIEKTTLSASTVKIRASESVHAMIKEVCVNVDQAKATKDFAEELQVKAYTGTGAEILRASEDTTVDIETITAVNVVYYTKTIPVDYQEITQISDNVTVSSIHLSQGTIKVKGEKSVLDSIENIMLPTENVVIDDGQESFTFSYSVSELLPEGVYSNDENEAIELNVYINKYIRKTLQIKTEDIAIKNIPEGLDASVESTGEIEIVVEGLEQEVATLEPENILAYVSLKNYNEGISSVPVELQLPEGVNKVEIVSVNVKLTKANTQTEPPEETTTPEQTSSEPPSENITDETETTEPETKEEETTTIPEEEPEI